jgi:hypothetical protein
MDPLTDTHAPPVPVGTPAGQVTALYQAYATGTGKSRLVYRLKGAYNLDVANVLWLSPDGSALVGSAFAEKYVKGRGASDTQAMGLIGQGTFKPINIPLSGVPLAGEIAF